MSFKGRSSPGTDVGCPIPEPSKTAACCLSGLFLKTSSEGDLPAALANEFLTVRTFFLNLIYICSAAVQTHCFSSSAWLLYGSHSSI